MIRSTLPLKHQHDILRLFDQGYSRAKIAEILNTTHSRVKHVVANRHLVPSPDSAWNRDDINAFLSSSWGLPPKTTHQQLDA